MASLAEIRARIAAQENKSNSGSTQKTSDNSIYPHWNMDEGTTATLLPTSVNRYVFFVSRSSTNVISFFMGFDPSTKRRTRPFECAA